MSVALQDNFAVGSPQPLDSRYGPWGSLSAAKAIPLAFRHIGLTVGVFQSGNIVEYWWKGGVLDSNLVFKTSGSIDLISGNGILFTPSGISTAVEIDTNIVQVKSLLSNNIIGDASSTIKYPSVKAIKDYVDNFAVGLLNDRGSYNPTITSLYPTSANNGSGLGGAIKKGDIWYINTAGTMNGNAVNIGASVRALTDSPGQTDANWDIIDAGLGFIPENVINKVTTALDVSLDPTSTVKYPSLSAMVDYVTNITTNIGVGTYVPYTGATGDVTLGSTNSLLAYQIGLWDGTNLTYNKIESGDDVFNFYNSDGTTVDWYVDQGNAIFEDIYSNGPNGVRANQFVVFGSVSVNSTIKIDNLTSTRTHQLPNANGTFALKVNSIAADDDGKITIPDADGSTTGLLSSSSWNTFNNKQDALTGPGIVKAVGGTVSYISGTSSQFVKGDGTLDSNTYALQSSISGTAGKIAKFTGSGSTIGDSVITESSGNIGINTPSPSYKLDVTATAGSRALNMTGNLWISNGGAGMNLINGSTNLIQAAGTNQFYGYISFASGSGQGNLISLDANAPINDAQGWIPMEVIGGINRASSNANNTIISLRPNYNFTGTYSGKTWGVYYNPILTSLNSTTHIAWENTTGDVLLNTTSGNVGIGTSSPTSKLYVNGDITISSPNYLNLSYVKIGGSVSQYGLNFATFEATEANTGIAIVAKAKGSPTTYGYNFQFLSTETGTNQLLFVGHNAAQKHVISTSTGTGGTSWPLVFRVPTGLWDAGGVTDLMTLTKDQRVGIGTSNPAYTLDVSGSANFYMSGNTASSPFGNKFSIRNGMLRIGVDGDNTNYQRVLQFTNENDTIESFLIGMTPGTGASTATNERLPIISMGNKDALYINSGAATTSAPITLGNTIVTFKKDGRIRYVPLASAPTLNIEEGDTYYNGTDHKLYVYNGTTWSACN